MANSAERIAVIDLADELQLRKQTIFKVLKRLGIRAEPKRAEERGNQLIATISQDDAAAIRADLRRSATNGSSEARALPAFTGEEVGLFYVIQLEPNNDQGRFKVGFTTDLDARLQKHRCSAPFAACLKTWPCRRTWERAAIDSVVSGCEQLHTEIFRTSALTDVIARGERFFAVMPSFQTKL